MPVDPTEIYERLESRYEGKPTRSKKLWKLRRAVDICKCNPSLETILEKAVANLAERGHMPEYYNQCPTISGIFSSHRCKLSAVDLVHWSECARAARLIELKWVGRGKRGNLDSALSQILRYGARYLFCRVHRCKLSLPDPRLMDVEQVTLEVVAPPSFYSCGGVAELVAEASGRLAGLAESKTGRELSMSLTALSFPDDFQELPFSTADEMLSACSCDDLTPGAGRVRDAFGALSPPNP